MKPGVILSMEQALSMTYATLRFVHLGWRVIKIEATPQRPGANAGDPNRYIGTDVAGHDRRSYFIAPNVGKESIALNLKTAEGQEALRRIIRATDADIFCCNTLPGRYAQLGIDYETLRQTKPDLIWAGISAMGPDYPDAAGYDPAIQALAGFMEVTGQRGGPPMLSGIPLIDLKAGDEVYANIWMALAERAMSGKGARIDVSMFQAAASWLITVLPLIDFGCEDWEITRSGNEHRKFVPTNAYPTADGAVLIAIGSDSVWRRFTEIGRFEALVRDNRSTNNGRIENRDAIHADIAAATQQSTTDEIVAELKSALVPHAPINDVRQVIDLAQIAGKLTHTTAPDGRAVRMQPKAVDFGGGPDTFGFPPGYGEQTAAILRQAGYSAGEIGALSDAGIVAGPRE